MFWKDKMSRHHDDGVQPAGNSSMPANTETSRGAEESSNAGYGDFSSKTTETANGKETDFMAGSSYAAESADSYAGNDAQASSHQTAENEAQTTFASPYGTDSPANEAAKPPTTYRYVGISGKKERRRFGWGAIVVLAVFFALCAAAAAFGAATIANRQSEQKIANLLDQTDTGILYRSVETSGNSGLSEEDSLSVADTCDLTVDSVVEISIQTVNYFGFGQSVSEGAGSGVIITDNGYIVTNNHVVADATTIRVILRNGEEYEATLIGRDEQSDLAVIKIDAENLTPAVFGSSDDLRVGDRVIAIGNPLGSLGGTVTVGYVSAKDRQITIEDQTMTLLQTDATINSGNSGGGLFNDKGELVGIAVAYASGIGVQGLNFFIPVDQVQPVVEDLMQYGYVRNRISLGVYLVDITDERTATSYRVEELGVYIVGYTGENTNAQLDGLQAGDRLVSIDGQAVENAADVSEMIQQHNTNDVITVVVSRNGEEKSINVVLREEVPEGVENGSTTPAGY